MKHTTSVHDDDVLELTDGDLIALLRGEELRAAGLIIRPQASAFPSPMQELRERCARLQDEVDGYRDGTASLAPLTSAVLLSEIGERLRRYKAGT